MKNKKRFLFLFLLMGIFWKSTPALAQRQPLYIPGFAGGMNTAVQPYPGVYLTEMLYDYFAIGIKDQNGNTVLPNLNLDMNIWFNGFSWVSPYKVLKAHYGINLFIPFANPIIDFGSDIGRQSNSFGLADMYFEPLSLGWNFPRVSTLFSFGIYLPVGRFNPGATNNLGRGTWAEQFNLGATVFLDKEHTWSITNNLRGEIHQQTRDTNLTIGSALTWEGAVGKTFVHVLDIAAEGYGQWQVTNNTGSPVFFPNEHGRIYGAGGEIGVAIPKIKSRFSMRIYKEFGGELRTQGTGMFLTFSSGLWNYKPPS
jgi:hypothetical protein